MYLCKCICVFVFLYFCLLPTSSNSCCCIICCCFICIVHESYITRNRNIFISQFFFCFNHLFHSKRLSEVSFKHQKTNFSFSSSITFIQPEACAVGKPYLLWEARPVKMFLIKFSKCSQYIYFFPKTTLMDAFGSIGTGETWDVGRLGSSCIFNISLFWIEYSTFYPFYFDILLFWFKYFAGNI